MTTVLLRRFDEETWAQLPDMLGKLPEKVRLHVWGDEIGSAAEQEAANVVRALADQFETVEYELFPRRADYDYYPVIGVMGAAAAGPIDYGVRIIGLPTGAQMTSLVAAIQAVSFRGMTLEGMTRIQLYRLPAEVTLQVLGAADVESAAVMAQMAFNMAVASPKVRSYLIMADAFPEVLLRYSVHFLPHTVINERVHISGVVDEATLWKHIADAVK